MNWDLDGQGCYACLTAIVTHLLKMTLNADRESKYCTADQVGVLCDNSR